MGICEEPASGDTLNRLGASLGYSRAAVESDDDYRVRILVEESVKDFVARNASTWEYIRKLGSPPGLDSEQIPAGLLPGASNQERFRCIERLKAEHRKWAEQYFREAVVVKRESPCKGCISESYCRKTCDKWTIWFSAKWRVIHRSAQQAIQLRDKNLTERKANDK